MLIKEKNYKIIISVLLTTNVISLIIVYFLCGEVYLLQQKLLDMMETVRTLEDKISRIEIDKEKGYEDIMALVCTVIICIVFSMYFGDTSSGGPGGGDDVTGQKLLDYIEYLEQQPSSIFDELD